MIDALPAFAGELVNSVIAPFVRPPSSTASKADKPVTSRSVGGNAFCGKRSARSLRRSMILLVAMAENMALKRYMFKIHIYFTTCRSLFLRVGMKRLNWAIACAPAMS